MPRLYFVPPLIWFQAYLLQSVLFSIVCKYFNSNVWYVCNALYSLTFVEVFKQRNTAQRWPTHGCTAAGHLNDGQSGRQLGIGLWAFRHVGGFKESTARWMVFNQKYGSSPLLQCVANRRKQKAKLRTKYLINGFRKWINTIEKINMFLKGRYYYILNVVYNAQVRIELNDKCMYMRTHIHTCVSYYIYDL